MKHSARKPSRWESADNGLTNAILFTLGCAGILTLRTFFLGMGVASLALFFLSLIALLAIPSGLAVIAGAFDGRGAKSIYLSLVSILTLVLFFGNLETVLWTTLACL